MEYSELTDGLAAGNVPSCVLLVGNEPFLRQQAVDSLREAALRGGTPGFNEDVLVGKGLRAETVLSIVRTVPMLADRRFVLVRDLAGMQATELEKLLPLLTQPSEDACLVLVADKLDGRSKFVKHAKKQKLVVELKELKGAALRAFIQGRCKARSRKISNEALSLLVDSVGSDLSALEDAVERLSLFVTEGVIEPGAVAACVSRVRAESIWALVDSVAERRASKAVLATAQLLKDREPPLRILALLARQLRLVSHAKEALDAGASPAEAAKRAGAPPFKARDLASAARKFGSQDLAAAFSIVAECDLELKGARRDGGAVLEEAVLRLCRGRAPRRYEAIVEQRRKLFRAGA